MDFGPPKYLSLIGFGCGAGSTCVAALARAAFVPAILCARASLLVLAAIVSTTAPASDTAERPNRALIPEIVMSHPRLMVL
jgi:hypothetical protein